MLNLQGKTTRPKEDWGFPAQDFLGHSSEGIFFRHSSVLLLRHSREGGNPVVFFLVSQLLGIRKKIISLVEVVHTDPGCSPCVVGCPPGGGKGKAATGDRCCGGGGSYPCRVGFEWRVYGFLSEVAPINKAFSLVQG